jgi:hypothetical protein
MRLSYALAIAAPMILTSTPAAAAEPDAQLWTQTTLEAGVGDGFTIGGHVIARFSDEEGGIVQAQYGVDADRRVAGGLRLGIGYSYVPSFEDGRVATREHRIRQQALVDLGEVAGGALAMRLRLEQRWRDDGDDLKLRFRPRVTWTRPVGPDGLAVRLMHESFYNVNETDWGGESRYDRMRNQVALRRDFGPVVTGEIGYLNQYRFGRGEEDTVDHALTLSLTFGF